MICLLMFKWSSIGLSNKKTTGTIKEIISNALKSDKRGIFIKNDIVIVASSNRVTVRSGRDYYNSGIRSLCYFLDKVKSPQNPHLSWQAQFQ